jgi:hypothetical protein
VIHRVATLMLVSVLMAPGSALAADPAQPTALPSERRLSPAQIQAVLDEAARKRELAPMAEDRLPPAIHGEIGFTVGTGGYRSAYGTAVVPLSEDGVAIVSFGVDNFSPERTVVFRER